jgi:flagellar biosynthesis chaperone FliJ
MGTFVFRLQPVLDRRIEARKKAEEALAEHQRALAAEQKTMRELEAAAESAVARYQRRRAERSVSGTSRGVPIRNQDSALFGLKLDVQAAQAAVLSQQIFVDQAFELVKEARGVLDNRKRDEDVLERFRQRALERFLREEAYREELEQDEIGNVMHLSRREKK